MLSILRSRSKRIDGTCGAAWWADMRTHVCCRFRVVSFVRTGLRGQARSREDTVIASKRAPMRKRRAELPGGPSIENLLRIYSISTLVRIDVNGAEGYEDVARFGWRSTDPFAQHFAGSLSNSLPRRGTPKAVNLIRVALGLRRVFNVFALIAENAQVIATFTPCAAPRFTYIVAPCPGSAGNANSHHHPTGFANRRKMVETSELLERRGGTFFERPHNIARLHVGARKIDFRHGSFDSTLTTRNCPISEYKMPMALSIFICPLNHSARAGLPWRTYRKRSPILTPFCSLG